MATYGIDRDVPMPDAAEAPAPEAPRPVMSATRNVGESDDIRRWRRELREARSILIHTEIVSSMNLKRATDAIEALGFLGVAP